MADVGFWEGIVQSLEGKGQFRLILQPAMALILGIRLGIADAKEGQAPFFLRLFKTKGRWQLFKRSLFDAALPLGLAFGMDCVLQYLALGRVRPLAAVVVGALLVWFPFTLTRAATNRIYGRMGSASVGRTPLSASASPSPPEDERDAIDDGDEHRRR